MLGVGVAEMLLELLLDDALSDGGGPREESHCGW